ncbi:MAG: TetR/AcrR family transcriptional regulator [Bdellovibrionaceae bacterium]|nr:TetR/AcrR family transcriptional regulator [Pseudobdellovibrionaceae bacterium]
MKTKDKIILTSVELFNKSGVVAITTNHIAKELGISPGNLYFHFRNKEEIIRHIFKIMCQETYALWHTKKGQKLVHPLVLIEKNFELFWKYRFFHREMYYLRRKDSQLNKMWKLHIAKVLKLMTLMYRRWIKAGWMKMIDNDEETQFVVNVLLATASTFLHFFESADRQPAKRHVENGKIYVARLLIHWTEGQMRQDFEDFIFSTSKKPS